MQHISLAVGGGQVGQRWSHGCQGEMESGCAAGDVGVVEQQVVLKDKWGSGP